MQSSASLLIGMIGIVIVDRHRFLSHVSVLGVRTPFRTPDSGGESEKGEEMQLRWNQVTAPEDGS
jgi:hypothetical protein